MKITIEKDGQVRSIEPDSALVLAMSGEELVESIEGTPLELGFMLGNSKPLAEHWDMLSKLVAITKIMNEKADAAASEEELQ